MTWITALLAAALLTPAAAQPPALNAGQASRRRLLQVDRYRQMLRAAKDHMLFCNMRLARDLEEEARGGLQRLGADVPAPMNDNPRCEPWQRGLRSGEAPPARAHAANAQVAAKAPAAPARPAAAPARPKPPPLPARAAARTDAADARAAKVASAYSRLAKAKAFVDQCEVVGREIEEKARRELEQLGEFPPPLEFPARCYTTGIH